MTLSTRFEEALVYAARLHATQFRKGTRIPYIAHLLGVTAIALDYGANEDEAIAALLHDAIEDQNVSVEGIRKHFGDTVAHIVEACTDAFERPKPPWQIRKKQYIAHLVGADRSVLLVSAADKLHNARAILADYRVLGETLWIRFNGGKEGTLWYYRQLVETFRAAGANENLTNELDRVITELERLVTEEVVSYNA